MQHERRRSDDAAAAAAHAATAATAAAEKASGVVNKLVRDVAQLQHDMEANTVLTKEIRDILKAFKLFGKCAQWVGIVAGASAAVATAYHKFKV